MIPNEIGINKYGSASLNIAKYIKNIQGISIPKKILKELEYMVNYIQIMLKKSFFVFLNQDLDKAKELALDDDKIE